MTRLSRARSGERLMPEMTSGQKVIGICVSMFLGVLCFAGGVLVGQYDPSIKQRALDQIVAKSPAAPAADGSSLQTSPRVDTAPKPAADGTGSPLPAKPEPMKNAFTRPAERSQRRLLELPPLPSPSTTPAADASAEPVGDPDAIKAVDPVSPEISAPPATPETVPAPATPPAPEPAPAPAPEPAPESPAPEKESNGGEAPRVETQVISELEPIVVADAANDTAPPAPPPPRGADKPAAVPTSPAAPATAKAGSGWGVQLGSFLGAGREAKAEELQRKLKQSQNLDAVILPSEDKKYYRIVVVGYKDKASAQAAVAELKKKLGFQDAFVRTVP